MATNSISLGIVTTGDTHTNTTLDTLADTSGVRVGMGVTGAGIPAGTTVSTINSATSVTLSAAATATATGVQVAFTTTTTGAPFHAAPALLPADMATIAQAIKDDLNPAHPTWPGAFSFDGILFVPNRGNLVVRPGDVVVTDSRGWPILLSADTIANGPWSLV